MLKRLQEVSNKHLPQVFQYINIIMNVVGERPKGLMPIARAGGEDGTVARLGGQRDASPDDRSFADAVNNIDKQLQRRKEDEALVHMQGNKHKISPHPDVAALDNKLAKDKQNADDLRRVDSKIQKDELRRLAEEREKKRIADEEERTQNLAKQDQKVRDSNARPRCSTTNATSSKPSRLPNSKTGEARRSPHRHNQALIINLEPMIFLIKAMKREMKKVKRKSKEKKKVMKKEKRNMKKKVMRKAMKKGKKKIQIIVLKSQTLKQVQETHLIMLVDQPNQQLLQGSRQIHKDQGSYHRFLNHKIKVDKHLLLQICLPPEILSNLL